MNADQLKAMQAPVKDLYRADPARAWLTLKASGTLEGERVACDVNTFAGLVPAGLHPATGGDGKDACSGNMLLEAVVGCAGVTLKAVATALGIAIRSGEVRAAGDLDARGTLGVDKQAPVGFTDIRLRFTLDADATSEQLDALLKLTERYCVVLQTLKRPPALSAEIAR